MNEQEKKDRKLKRFKSIFKGDSKPTDTVQKVLGVKGDKGLGKTSKLSLITKEEVSPTGELKPLNLKSKSFADFNKEDRAKIDSNKEESKPLLNKPSKVKRKKPVKKPASLLSKSFAKGESGAKVEQKSKEVIKEVAKAEGLALDKDQMNTAALGLVPILLGGLLGGTDGALAGVQAGATGIQVKADIEAKEAASKEESRLADKKLDIDAEETESKGELRDSQIKLNAAKAASLALKDSLAAASPKTNQRFSKLGADTQKRLGSIVAADRGITEMVKSIQSGENLFELIGESKYTDARNRFVEGIARLQSGAAISEKEFDIFTGFAPATKDAKDVIEEKIKRNIQFVNDQLHISGFSREELNLPLPISLKSKEDLINRREELLQKRGQ